jgi:hypothetical protein
MEATDEAHRIKKTAPLVKAPSLREWEYRYVSAGGKG